MSEFINPYTFIPVSEGEKKSYSEYFKENLLSGKISCTLKARTQLAVCDKVAENDFDFFKVDGKAIIPGSSLRGTIRSIFEGLTDSCFSSTNAEDDDYFSSRLNKDKPGLLSFDGENYILYDAERYKDKNNNYLNDYKTGDEVRFTDNQKEGRGGTIRYFKLNDNGMKKGYVHKVDRLMKSKDSVFEKKGRGHIVSGKSVKLLEINLEKYEPKNKAIAVEYMNQFDKMKKGEGMLPVWYYKEDEKYYFAPSQMSRTIFYTQPIDMLKEKNLDKCTKNNAVCEACALFGMIGDKTEDTKSSRVRFSDAICEDKNCFDKKYLLEVLGSPRLSSFEFYLKSDEKQFHADTKGVTIAGRKYYWHHKGNVIKKDADLKSENMQSKVELVKAGSEFTFEIFFERITETQLKKLVFSLNLGENSIDSDKCHKVGHGKPIGLGSAKIVVDSVKIRKYNEGIYKETEIAELLENNKGEIFYNHENVENILKVTDMNAVDRNLISYPKADASKDIFKWFAGNREALKSFGKPMKYYQKLPDLNAKNQRIIMDFDKKSSGGAKKGGYGDKNNTSSYSSGSSEIKFGSIMSKEERYKRNDKSKKRK